jgi:hypothetical protein
MTTTQVREGLARENTTAKRKRYLQKNEATR